MRPRSLVPVLAFVLVSCGGGSGGASTSGTTTTSVRPTTTERQESSSPVITTEPTTTTVERVGLPLQFPVLPDNALTLTDDSTQSQTLTISQVDLVAVHDWFANGIVTKGFEVTFDDGYTRIEFHGRGSDGIAMLTDRGDGVHIDVVIQQFRPFK